MNVRLMHPEQDFAADGQGRADLFFDLGLTTVVETMADGDEEVRAVSSAALATPPHEVDAILYRQAVLADFLKAPWMARRLHELASEAVAAERREFLGTFARSPELVLSRSLRLIARYADVLERLHADLAAPLAASHSAGLSRLGRTIDEDAGPGRLTEIRERLRELGFAGGIVMSARLGTGLRGSEHVLKTPPADERGWLSRLVRRRADGVHFEVSERDESGLRLLGELRSKGLAQAAGAVQVAADDMLAFFRQLRTESAFYVGCVNLAEALARRGVGVSMPVPEKEPLVLEARGLVDPVLALTGEGKVVASDLQADGARLVVVTGPNQGGKSTFLRSLGVAHVLMMCGMFVPAAGLRASLAEGVFTHFSRREEEEMERGRLAEELARLSGIVDELRPGCLLLFSEPFASTNEEEGSAIASEVLEAMGEAGVRVVFVTHLLELAARLAGEDGVVSVRAERAPDGRRTFRMLAGPPELTSHARDLFEDIFGPTGNG